MMKENMFIRFIYGTCAGRILLKFVTKRKVSVFMGRLLDSYISKPLINFYIKKYSIDMSEYVQKDYRSFNEFFIRKRKDDIEGADYSDDILISPCDGMLSIYEVDENAS